MRKKVRFLLAGLLVADVLLIGYLMYDYIQNKIPDSVLTYVCLLYTSPSPRD